MAKHTLDNDQVLFPNPDGTNTDLSGDERFDK